MEKIGRFRQNSVDVRGLSRKQAAIKRKQAYREWLQRKEMEQLWNMETNREERNAWKARSFLANKMRQ